jgi:branched-chain amino acid transport system substrate-binding protein
MIEAQRTIGKFPAAVLGLGLAAALVAAPASAQVKIGAVLSASGPASFLGDPEKKTLEIYIQDINAKGGINGKKLQLVVYDDGGDANAARTFATRLVEEDEVVAMVGGTTTGTTMAMIPVFEDAQIPFISLAGAVEIIQPVRKWVFKTPHTDRMACEKIFADLKRRNMTTVALISGTDAFGHSMRDQCVAVAPQAGIKIAAVENYGPGDSDITPQLTKIKAAAGVQAVINTGFGQGPAIVTRNYRQLDIAYPFYQSHGVASKQFIDLAGAAANGVRLPAAALLVADKLPDSDPQKPVVVAYKKTFEAGTKQPVSTFGGHAYDGLMILTQAAQRAGSFDKAKVRDEIERTKGYIGTGGKVSMSPADHLGLDLSAFRMLEIRNGDWTLVPDTGL